MCFLKVCQQQVAFDDLRLVLHRQLVYRGHRGLRNHADGSFDQGKIVSFN